MNSVDADDLPALRGFVHGPRVDLPVVRGQPNPTDSNGPIEGTHTKVELLKRQMYGRRDVIADGSMTAAFVRPP